MTHGVGHAMLAAEVEAGRRRGETVLPLPLTDLTNFGAPAALAPSNMGSTMGRSQAPGSGLATGLLGLLLNRSEVFAVCHAWPYT